MAIITVVLLAVQAIFLVLAFIGLSRLEKNKKLQSENKRLRQMLEERQKQQEPPKRADRGDLL